MMVTNPRRLRFKKADIASHRGRVRRAAIIRAAARGSSACKIFADGIDRGDEAY